MKFENGKTYLAKAKTYDRIYLKYENNKFYWYGTNNEFTDEEFYLEKPRFYNKYFILKKGTTVLFQYNSIDYIGYFDGAHFVCNGKEFDVEDTSWWIHYHKFTKFGKLIYNLSFLLKIDLIKFFPLSFIETKKKIC